MIEIEPVGNFIVEQRHHRNDKSTRQNLDEFNVTVVVRNKKLKHKEMTAAKETNFPDALSLTGFRSKQYELNEKIIWGTFQRKHDHAMPLFAYVSLIKVFTYFTKLHSYFCF